MQLTDYEVRARREIEAWQRGRSPMAYQAFNWLMTPFDWAVDQLVPDEMIDQVGEGLSKVLATLGDAADWTYTEGSIVKRARRLGLEVDAVGQLLDQPLESLDPLAQSYADENSLLAAVEGGGTGLGGAVFIAADIPLLFGINFRLIRMIGGSYGLSVRGDEYYPLVLAVFNVAASDSQVAKSDALREASVAAAAFAHDQPYRGRRMGGTLHEQSRQLPREIAKSMLGRKLGQVIPLAGAVVGAGVNYWFTRQTATTATNLFRAIYIERKERL